MEIYYLENPRKHKTKSYHKENSKNTVGQEYTPGWEIDMESVI